MIRKQRAGPHDEAENVNSWNINLEFILIPNVVARVHWSSPESIARAGITLTNESTLWNSFDIDVRPEVLRCLSASTPGPPPADEPARHKSHIFAVLREVSRGSAITHQKIKCSKWNVVGQRWIIRLLVAFLQWIRDWTPTELWKLSRTPIDFFSTQQKNTFPRYRGLVSRLNIN